MLPAILSGCQNCDIDGTHPRSMYRTHVARRPGSAPARMNSVIELTALQPRRFRRRRWRFIQATSFRSISLVSACYRRWGYYYYHYNSYEIAAQPGDLFRPSLTEHHGNTFLKCHLSCVFSRCTRCLGTCVTDVTAPGQILAARC